MAAGTAGDAVALRLAGVTMEFEGVKALDNVDLEVRRGEVHALLGQNGSGKSTLIKVLAGLHAPKPGARMWVHGAERRLRSPADAAAAGIRFIHQDLGLVDSLSVLDNLTLGGRYYRSAWVSDGREAREARRLLDQYRVDVNPRQLVGTLTSAEATMVAIVRALRDGQVNGGVLVLDEPTASLPDGEVHHVFRIIRAVTANGGSVLYVTHRLNEVLEVADRVTVLRDGHRVLTRARAGLDHDTLVEAIVGRRVDALYPAPATGGGGQLALDVQGLSGPGVANLSLSVRTGEVVGIAGITGSGAENVLPLIFGDQPGSCTQLRLCQHAVRRVTPRTAIRSGVAYIPPDRIRQSGFAEWNLAENLTLPALRSKRWLGGRGERRDAAGWIRRLGVQPPEPAMRFAHLSGGNQQKVIIARWLRCGGKLFLLNEPTAGVDVGARAAIYQTIKDIAADGAGVVIYSTDVEELCGLSQRVLIVNSGVITRELTGDDITPDRVTAEMLRDPDTQESGS